MDKQQFRTSKEWKEFRKRKFAEQQKDPVTGSKLSKMANLHHKDLDETHYTDISDENNFVLVNPKTHATIHFFFSKKYPKQWRKRIEEITKILEDMERINTKDITEK